MRDFERDRVAGPAGESAGRTYERGGGAPKNFSARTSCIIANPAAECMYAYRSGESFALVCGCVGKSGICSYVKRMPSGEEEER